MVALLRHQPGRRPLVEGPTSESVRDSIHDTLGVPRPQLRLVPVGTDASPGSQVTVAPPLRLVPGIEPSARPRALTVAAVAILVFGLFAMIRIAQAPDARSLASDGSTTGVGARAAAVAVDGDQLMVVAPGDTLWSIASGLAPGEDPRPAVATLIEVNGGDSLQIGQQIVIPGHLLD